MLLEKLLNQFTQDLAKALYNLTVIHTIVLIQDKFPGGPSTVDLDQVDDIVYEAARISATANLGGNARILEDPKHHFEPLAMNLKRKLAAIKGDTTPDDPDFTLDEDISVPDFLASLTTKH